MKKIKFTGKVTFGEYHSHLVDFKDGEIKTVSDDLADYLLKDFPDHFTEIKSPPKSKGVDKPPKDKMFRKGSAKIK